MTLLLSHSQSSSLTYLDRPHIWIHAASLGDVNAISPLVQSLIQDSIHSSASDNPPIYRLSGSATTASGRQQWCRKWPQIPCYLPPLGPPPHAWCLFQYHKPNLLILELLEVWPHWVQSWSRKGVRIGVVNGRISERTHSLGKRWLKSSFKKLDFFLAQTEIDAQRAADLGVPLQKIKVCGNSKYDQWTFHPPSPCVQKKAHPILFDLIIANVQADEEDELCHSLDLFISRLASSELPIRACIAPRHLKRKKALQKKLNRILKPREWAIRLRSSLPPLDRIGVWTSTWNPQREVVLLDSYGELKSLYAHAQVTIMGGGFGSRGGQSLIEAAQTGRPVLYGPHIPYIQIEHHLLQGQNGHCVQSWSDAFRSLPYFLNQPTLLPKLHSLNGALFKQLQYLTPILNSL